MEGWAKAAVLPSSTSGITTAYFIALTSNCQSGSQSDSSLPEHREFMPCSRQEWDHAAVFLLY
jgi:hypothetical protein